MKDEVGRKSMRLATDLARHALFQRTDPSPVSMPALPAAPFVTRIKDVALNKIGQGSSQAVIRLQHDFRFLRLELWLGVDRLLQFLLPSGQESRKLDHLPRRS